MPMTKDKIDELLTQPNVAVLAVTAPDGAPHAVPTWYEYDKVEVVFHTARSAFKYDASSAIRASRSASTPKWRPTKR